MIESRNAVGQYDTTLQLKAQVLYCDYTVTATLDKNVYMHMSQAAITYMYFVILYRVKYTQRQFGPKNALLLQYNLVAITLCVSICSDAT